MGISQQSFILNVSRFSFVERLHRCDLLILTNRASPGRLDISVGTYNAIVNFIYITVIVEYTNLRLRLHIRSNKNVFRWLLKI